MLLVLSIEFDPYLRQKSLRRKYKDIICEKIDKKNA